MKREAAKPNEKSTAKQTALPAENKETLSLEALFGAYQTDESAEEIIAALRASRVFTRTIEPL